MNNLQQLFPWQWIGAYNNVANMTCYSFQNIKKNSLT